MTDTIAERARKIGAGTLRSIADISRHQRLKDSDEEFVAPKGMLSELRADNLELTGRCVRRMRSVTGTTTSPPPA